ncbi:MAG: hypothetical protein QW666_02485 [Candidatus Woesearchaeota archaeon]
MTIPEVANRIMLYLGIDHILIDPSRGKGIDFDIEHSAALYSAIKAVRPTLSIGLQAAYVETMLSRLLKSFQKKLAQ